MSGFPWYYRGDVPCFGQFGVEPSLQKRGIGLRLLETVEATAARAGIANLGLDTAEQATELVAMYQSRGFEIVGFAQWDITNYRSVVMNKTL